MTLEELKTRCEALASVGDEQARCTLEYLFNDPGRAEREVVELREKNAKLAAKNLQLYNENAKLKWEAKPATAQKEEVYEKARELGFQGVKVNGIAVDGVEPRPAAVVPHPRRLSNDPAIQGTMKEAEAGPGQVERIKQIAKAFNVSETEAKAVEATRSAHGLSAVSSPEVTAAATDIKTAKETIPGGTKAEGNKE